MLFSAGFRYTIGLMPKGKMNVQTAAALVLAALEHENGKYADDRPVRPVPFYDWQREEGASKIAAGSPYEKILDDVQVGNAAAWWGFAVYSKEPPLRDVEDKDLTAFADKLGIPLSMSTESPDGLRDIRALLNPVYISERYRDPAILFAAYMRIAEMDVLQAGDIWQVMTDIGRAADDFSDEKYLSELKESVQPKEHEKSDVSELDIPEAIKGIPIAAKELKGEDAFEKYLEARKYKITASSIASAFPADEDGTRAGFEFPVEFWESQKGLRSRKEVTPEMIIGATMQPVTERGAIGNPILAELNPKRLDEASEVLYQHYLPQFSHIAATPDLVLEIDSPYGTGERVLAIVECKTTLNWNGFYLHKDEKGADIIHPPQGVLTQLFTQMDVMGIDFGYVAVFPYGSRLPKDRTNFFENVWLFGHVTQDPEKVAEIRENAGHMKRCLEENIHPSEDEIFYGNLPAHRIGVAEWYNHVENETKTVTGDSSTVAMHAEYKDLTSRETEMKKQKEKIKDDIRAQMGDAQKMLAEDGSVLFTLSGKKIVNSEKLWDAIADKSGKKYVKKNADGEEVKDWHKALAENPLMLHEFMEQSGARRTFSAK